MNNFFLNFEIAFSSLACHKTNSRLHKYKLILIAIRGCHGYATVQTLLFVLLMATPA